MKKLLILALSSLSLALVGCSGELNGEELNFDEIYKEKSEITVWLNDSQGDYMKAVVSEFNKENPNIIVKFQHMSSGETIERLKTYGPTGNGADVIQFPHDQLAGAISADLVGTFNASFEEKMAERLDPTALKVGSMSYDSSTGSFDSDQEARLFAVPTSLKAVTLAYNKDLVSTPVTTFEQLFAEADAWALDEKNGNIPYFGTTGSDWADAYWSQFAFSAFGARPFGEDGVDADNVGFDSQAYKDALNWMATELKPRVTGNLDSNSGDATAFELGKQPYALIGPWNYNAYRASGLNFGMITMPTVSVNGEAKAADPFLGADMTSVYKYSKNKADAEKFVEFLTSDVALMLLYEENYKYPALKAELIPQEILDDPIMLALSQQIESALPMPTIPSVVSYWPSAETMIKEVWNTQTNDLNALIERAVANAMINYNEREAQRKQ